MKVLAKHVLTKWLVRLHLTQNMSGSSSSDVKSLSDDEYSDCLRGMAMG